MAKLLITLTVLCVLGTVLNAAEFDKSEAIADFMAKAEECRKDVGAKEDELKDMFERKPPTTMESKCLRACIMKKYEVMDDNGKFVKSVAEKHAQMFNDGADDKMKIAQEILNTCSAIEVSSDHCEAAVEYGNCFKEQAEAHGLVENAGM